MQCLAQAIIATLSKAQELIALCAGHFHVNVYAIQKWARDGLLLPGSGIGDFSLYSDASNSRIVKRAALRTGITLATAESKTTTPNQAVVWYYREEVDAACGLRSAILRHGSILSPGLKWCVTDAHY